MHRHTTPDPLRAHAVGWRAQRPRPNRWPQVATAVVHGACVLVVIAVAASVAARVAVWVFP